VEDSTPAQHTILHKKPEYGYYSMPCKLDISYTQYQQLLLYQKELYPPQEKKSNFIEKNIN